MSVGRGPPIPYYGIPRTTGEFWAHYLDLGRVKSGGKSEGKAKVWGVDVGPMRAMDTARIRSFRPAKWPLQRLKQTEFGSQAKIQAAASTALVPQGSFAST